MKTFEKAVAVVTVLAAVAYSLGWLKTLTYFQTLGIGLSSLDLSIQDYLFESWFVVENIVLFVLFSWILRAGLRLELLNGLWKYAWRFLLSVSGLLYLMLPYRTDWAFGHLDWKFATWLVSHYYSLLKFTPFAVFVLLCIVVLYLVHWKWQPLYDTLENLFRTRPWHHLYPLYFVILLGWSISLAKHVGAIDAKNRLLDPAKNLSRVEFHVSSSSPELKPLETNQNVYLFYESSKKYFAWDRTGFVFGRGQEAHILVIPREKVEWIRASKELQIDPGAILF
jgi:hypothetical protein